MGEASRELDLISSDAQAEDQGNDNWVQVFKAAVEKKVGTGAVQDKVSSLALLMQVLKLCYFVCCLDKLALDAATSCPALISASAAGADESVRASYGSGRREGAADVHAAEAHI